MPMDKRLMPACLKSAKRFSSTVPGLASKVISINGEKVKRAEIAVNNFSMACAENKLGVPPPKKILIILRPQMLGNCISGLRIKVSMYKSSGMVEGALWELKSQ